VDPGEPAVRYICDISLWSDWTGLRTTYAITQQLFIISTYCNAKQTKETTQLARKQIYYHFMCVYKNQQDCRTLLKTKYCPRVVAASWQLSHLYLPPVDPRCHGNNIWDKIGDNLACVRDFCEIFALIRGFSEMDHRMLPNSFYLTNPRCHGNEIWHKIYYNSACVKHFCKIFAVLEDWYHHIVLTHSCKLVSFFYIYLHNGAR